MNVVLPALDTDLLDAHMSDVTLEDPPVLEIGESSSSLQHTSSQPKHLDISQSERPAKRQAVASGVADLLREIRDDQRKLIQLVTQLNVRVDSIETKLKPYIERVESLEINQKSLLATRSPADILSTIKPPAPFIQPTLSVPAPLQVAPVRSTKQDTTTGGISGWAEI